MDLTGRNILVTGASSGIGRETAIHLSRLGAGVIIVARNEERLEETFGLLEKGQKHYKVSCDLNHTDQIKDLYENLATNNIKLDGLVHSAGIVPVMPLKFTEHDKLSSAMSINYFSFIELVRYFTKRKYSNGGSIVAVSSVSSMAGWDGAVAYCGTKGALDSSVRALAIELAKKSIRVNTVVPSNIKTRMFDDLTAFADQETLDKIVARQPLGLGEPIDVANAVAFLLSDAAKFITGTSMVVDGGYLAQ
jgi:NAD(P)-dependent dehydrogenase (short-subunit alcohol dehydrogenase family)